MIWTLIFFLSIFQGLFSISIILYRKFNNLQASYLIVSIVSIIILINADWLITTSEIYRMVPSLHGFSYGTMLLMGPLFYWYTKSILDETFVWKPKYLLHFIPYVLKSFHTLTFFVISNSEKIKEISDFVNDQMAIKPGSFISLSLQIIHLAIYLYFTKKLISENSDKYLNTTYIITFEKRLKWLNTLFYCFVAYFISFTFWFVVVAIKGFYIASADYINIIIMSAIIYFLALKSALEPELVSPNFIRKYNAQANISTEIGIEFEQKLKYLMFENQLYLNAELDLNGLAKAMELQPYQCSRLINNCFEKGFFDLLNIYRIEEVKRRLKDPHYQHFSILGIALQTGFNSKSSFNTAFRKITGMTPSDFKKESNIWV